MIQVEGEILHPEIHMLLIFTNLIWSKDESPQQWKESIIASVRNFEQGQ
jgi:hypothetical protein